MKPSGAHYIQGEGESWICSSLRGEGCGGILLLSTATSWEDVKKDRFFSEMQWRDGRQQIKVRILKKFIKYENFNFFSP